MATEKKVNEVTLECLNNGKSIEVPIGTSLEEAYAKTGL